MHDDAAARLLDRRLDRVHVERKERAQVDDLGIHPGLLRRRLGDMGHRAVTENRDPFPLAPERRLAQRHDIAPRRNLAQGMLRPGRRRLVGMAGKRPVVEPLRLQEDDRIVVLDRGDQKALGVVGIGRDDGLESGDVGEQRLRALAVRLPAINAAAAGHADHDRRGKLAARAVAQARRLRDDLVVGRINIVGELDFRRLA